jgi:hypothetical protein
MILAMLVAAFPTVAQWRHLPPDGARVTKEDYEHQQVAAQRLLNAEPPRIGATEAWSNPSTGAGGTVTLLGTRTLQGLPCRTLRYAITARGMTRPMDMTFTLCQTGDGSWRIAG